MKASREPALRARILRRPTIRPAGPVDWTVRLVNSGTATVHVATAIQQLDAAPDGRTLVVSTERPILDSSVQSGLFALDTVPVQPGATFDHDFHLDFPLRLNRMLGDPPWFEVVEWRPAPNLTLITHLAFGDQPFQVPTDRARLPEAMHRWTQTIRPPAMRLRTTMEGQ